MAKRRRALDDLKGLVLANPSTGPQKAECSLRPLAVYGAIRHARDHRLPHYIERRTLERSEFLAA